MDHVQQAALRRYHNDAAYNTLVQSLSEVMDQFGFSLVDVVAAAELASDKLRTRRSLEAWRSPLNPSLFTLFDPSSEEWSDTDSMLYDPEQNPPGTKTQDRRSYRCECGCNVFRKSKHNNMRFKCNSCGATHTGESVTRGDDAFAERDLELVREAERGD
jgi:hypothetical protein